VSGEFSLTVVVPFFNFPKLEDSFVSCVERALGIGIQFVVVCSPQDESWSAIMGQNPGLRIIHGEFRDPGSARNAGLDAASTDWICFWDADDLPRPEEFIRLVRDTSNANKAIGLGAFSIVSESRTGASDVVLTSSGRDAISTFLAFPGIWRFVFRYSHVRNLRFASSLMGEDQVFLGQAIIDFRDIFIGKNVVYEYQIHSNQLTKSSAHRKEIKKTLTEMGRLGFARPSVRLNLKNIIFLKNSITCLKVNGRLSPTQLRQTLILVLLHPLGSSKMVLQLMQNTQRQLLK
jgi:hypothetical protein